MSEQIKLSPRPDYIQRNLIGCLETALFMPKGAERFSESYGGMQRSFILPLLAFPITAATFIGAHPDAMSSQTVNTMTIVYALRTVVYLACFLGVAYLASKALDRKNAFYRLIAAHNWLVIPAALLTLPLTLGHLYGAYSWEEVYPFILFIMGYSIAYMAYATKHVLQIPVELAICLAICFMGLNQTALNVVKWACVNGLTLLA